jgi:hypothetical protein
MANRKRNPEGEHAFKARFSLAAWQWLEARAIAEKTSVNHVLDQLVRREMEAQVAGRKKEDLR